MMNDLYLLMLLVFLIICLVTDNYFLRKNLKKERNYFINILNHDIKVALIAQLRGLEIVIKNKDCTNEILEEILQSCKYTFEMITLLANTYNHKLKENVLNIKKINLSSLIINSYRELYQAGKITNPLSPIKPENDFILADEDNLKKALQILFLTASQNSKENKNIKVSLSHSKKQVIIDITYTGNPLSNEECKRMFEKSPKFSTVGHGIKMYFCKKILEFHNGKIKTESKKNGENSFIIYLPSQNKTQTKMLSSTKKRNDMRSKSKFCPI